ncbi:hypothetical protein G7Y89_g7426 [Cudoniella acicularis]|uniref:Uncharacterized protein n=1 Tax=Cudoniella acicularis TaxID=354080 RepID=A0A8H4RIH0_9HELO|nr:hypothetical protein G7Y89_g7426 [Cudoniella acicularis]
MPPIRLSPNRGLLGFTFLDAEVKEPSNLDLQRHIERRDKKLKSLNPADDTQIHASHFAASDLPLGLTVPLYSSIRSPKFFPPGLTPLNECILAIAWELNNQSSACDVLEIFGNSTLESFITLLRSGAIYQAKLERVRPTSPLQNATDSLFQDQLIAQSLICLRSYLEEMSVKDDFIHLSSHEYCHDSCEVQCISDLESDITLHLDGLSRVFFKKGNLKARNGYRISVFYSFCIRATVRKLLQRLSGIIMISSSFTSVVESTPSASKQFLHLAVNLLIASSGAYNPLSINYPLVDPGHISNNEDIILLQQALGGRVENPAEYLGKLFEIEEIRAPKEIKRRGWYHCPIFSETPVASSISDDRIAIESLQRFRQQCI